MLPPRPARAPATSGRCHIDLPELPFSEKSLPDFLLLRQRNFVHITDVNNSKRSGTADPGRPERMARPRGRPPLPAEAAKRSPLTVRTTKAQKDELLRAAKAAGRSLAEEIDFRLGAVQAHPALEGDFEQILAGLEEVMDLIAELETTLEDVASWVYATTLALRKATGAGGTGLMWDASQGKFIPRPAELPPVVRPDADPKPPEPKLKSRRR
jgi:hypothetical protein